jgi:hypothetical protein
MSPELQTLDQLLGGDLPLAIVRGFFDTDVRFAQAVAAMLHAGEVRLYADDIEVPSWQWGEVLANACARSGLTGARLAINEMGARRIG